MRHRFRFRYPMALLVASILGLVRTAIAAPLDFSSADFTIMNADASAVIGSLHFDVSPPNNTQIVTSEARYADGEYDVERDELEVGGAQGRPRMATFDHGFFRADKSLLMRAKADFKTGAVTCTSSQGQTTNQTMTFPPDTYAGAGMILPLEYALRSGQDAPVALHDFVCMPGPKLLKIEATTRSDISWPHFPGNLIRADFKPNFGMLSYVIAPFVPDMHAWFSRQNDFDFVGGKFSRYYKGPEIVLAREKIQRVAQAADEKAR